jgi:hypothetical protein
MISHVDIIGALVYRTREALNKVLPNQTYSTFFENVVKYYKYWEVLFDSPNVLHLWHFAGTPDEIRETIERIGKSSDIGSKLTFPCIFNYQSVVETHGVGDNGLIRLEYDLAIGAPVDSQWTTEQRNRTVHKYVLEPIFDEFMNQVRKCGWFQLPLEGIEFTRMKVFTTGSSMNKAIQTQYGWYFDTIQINDFRPLLRPSLCVQDVEQIEKEAELVTDSILLNNNKK